MNIFELIAAANPFESVMDKVAAVSGNDEASKFVIAFVIVLILASVALLILRHLWLAISHNTRVLIVAGIAVVLFFVIMFMFNSCVPS
jgi:heme/copper-type cytochrome/quinol oxidase subunit 4